MKFNLSQSKIQSSLNFREVLQPQSVNKFTLYVCPTSRLLKQSHKFCTQRAETQALLAAQRKNQPLPSPRFARLLRSKQKTLEVFPPFKGGSTESLPLWGRFRGGYSALSALCVKSSALQCQCVESIKRQWQTCLMMGF